MGPTIKTPVPTRSPVLRSDVLLQYISGGLFNNINYCRQPESCSTSHAEKYCSQPKSSTNHAESTKSSKLRIDEPVQYLRE